MRRQNVSSGTPWEEKVGYSRVVRAGVFVYVSGTTAADATGAIQHPGDLYGQAVYIFDKIEAALQGVGAELVHVVRTRMYITDMAQSEQVMLAHHNYFETIRPASTLVEVSQLAVPEMLVEIEVDAVVGD